MQNAAMTPDDVTALFTRPDGAYRFSRWARPVAPVVFGVDDATLGVIRAAIAAATGLAGLETVEIDPDLGANLMVFFFAEWDELREVPDLGEMLPDLEALLARLEREDAQSYRTFRFDDAGAIRACFSFVRMGGKLARAPADAIAMAEALGMLASWARTPPLARDGAGQIGPAPAIAGLIRAAYDPVLPDASDDPSHALRLWARMQAAEAGGKAGKAGAP